MSSTTVTHAPTERRSPSSFVRQGWVAPAAVATAAVGVMTYLGRVSPYAPGNYPTCPTLAVAGVYCPGCGALRTLHDVANLDLVGAWGMNPLTLLALPLLVGLWVAWTRRRVTGRPRTWLAPPWAMHLLLGVVLVFWVLRNVPALAPWLAPGGLVAPAFGG